MKSKNLPFELESMKPIIETLGQVFGGDHFEFVLHDFRYPESSLVFIRGNVTGRNVGAPLTDRLWSLYQKDKDEVKDVINLRTRTKEGALVNTSTVFIRNREGKVLGSLGINIDINAFQMVVDSLNDIISGITNENVKEMDFAKDVKEFLNDILEQNMKLNAKNYATKRERFNLVMELEEQGIFLVKGAVEEVARRLGVTRFTIYNYLDEIRGR